MRRSTPIQRRLVDSRPSTVSEALLIAVVKKHKAGPAPALPASTQRRIASGLGEHPPRVSLPSIWPALRAVAAVALALVSLNAVALVGVRVIAAVKIHFGEGRAQAVRVRGEPPSTQKPSSPSALPLARPPSPPPLVLAGQPPVIAAPANSDASDTTGRSLNPGEPSAVARKSAPAWSRAPVPIVAAPNHRREESVAGAARLPEAL